MKALCLLQRPTVGQLEHYLALREVETPTPSRGELLVRVLASSINVDDVHLAERSFFGAIGGARPTPRRPVTPGVDVAGVVEAVGPGVVGFAPGDEVLGILSHRTRHGGWGEYCCIPAANVVRKPVEYTFPEAAACALGGRTAANAVMEAAVPAGGAALVVGASGGIGSLIVQILAHHGIEVTGVCSSRNTEAVQGLGAVRVIDYTHTSFDEVPDLPPMDTVIDCTGGKDVYIRARRILKKTGRFVTLVGPRRFVGDERLAVSTLAGILGEILYRMVVSRISGPRYVLAGLSTSMEPLEQLLLRQGIKPRISGRLDFSKDSARVGIAHVRTHHAGGKVVLVIDPGGG